MSCTYILFLPSEVNDDYEPTDVQLHFSPELSQQSAVINIVDDDIQEPPESLLVRLELGTGQTSDGLELGADVTITIENDDSELV